MDARFLPEDSEILHNEREATPASVFNPIKGLNWSAGTTLSMLGELNFDHSPLSPSPSQVDSLAVGKNDDFNPEFEVLCIVPQTDARSPSIVSKFGIPSPVQDSTVGCPMTPPTQQVDPMDLTPSPPSHEELVESTGVDSHLMDTAELTPPPVTFRQLAADSGSNIEEPSMVIDADTTNPPILDPFDLSPLPPTQSQPRHCSPFNLSPPPPSNPQQLFSF
ncbi:hypothetical protein JAAARDRAFT_200941 [Jaapia argillacea MUCL 33604]|uniref:Uncharacterized protein n=1 Tax=Jaapia argillacea MUCL 33604 TaxID=933084 RepID=A0A067PFW2_9AGAM|nr:hypothetical protein JAAARDRAFT_200941 [Jaapia argillacea MUCL 33604]